MTVDLVTWVQKRLDEDPALDDEAGLLVLAALDGDHALDEYLGGGSAPQPTARSVKPESEPTGAFLKSIRVEGFRGVGAAVEVQFSPAPGLTIVAGRNGSGKSSIAEAFEVALTGSTYRWKNKSEQWREQWRNLHHPSPASIQIELAEEGHGVTKVGLIWPSDAQDVSASDAWVQRPGEKRQAGRDALGWRGAVDTYRPMMSYDELGGMLEAGPSALYDALAKALGVELISDAIKRLDDRLKALRAPGASLAPQRKALQVEAAAMDDERAQLAAGLLRTSAPDVDRLRGIVTGVVAPDTGPLAGLRAIDSLQPPDAAAVAAAAATLRQAVGDMASAGEAASARDVARLAVRKQALEVHDEFGDMSCPACSSGDLDASWAKSSRILIEQRESELADLSAARERLEHARRGARSLVAARPRSLDRSPAANVDDEVQRARAAWEAWAATPADDLALADHLQVTSGPLVEAVRALKAAVAAELQARHDVWTPLAGRVAAFCEEWESWLEVKPQVDRLAAATKWLSDNDVRLKNERLEPIAEAARDAWAKLRQESNVELGSLTLQGTRTRRRVHVSAAVDGKEAGALAVMSQGELHALSLALFLPRASLPESPFRFLVLDDPVQAMDPAKVDGLVELLADLARTRQVIVLSHDDRLPAAARRARVGARVLEVSRGTDSVVNIAAGSDPATRYLRDAHALVKDVGLPDQTLRQTLPGLLRLAVESASRDVVFEARLTKGASLVEVERLWNDHRLTRERVSLAVFDEVRDLASWLGRPHRKHALGIVTSAVHTGLTPGWSPVGAVEAVRDLVNDIRERRKQ